MAQAAVSIQSAVYNELKQGIMTLRLAPGTTMSTQEMATRLNVSRTPVREAFITLQKEGLVDILPQRETQVSRIDLERVGEESFIRTTLELGAVDLMVQNAGPEDIAHLRANIGQQKEYYRQNRGAEFVQCDDAFHGLLFAAAKQPLAWQTICSVVGHFNRTRVYLTTTAGIMPDLITMHSAMVDLLLQKDTVALRKILLEHFNLRDLPQRLRELQCQNPDYFCFGSAEDAPLVRPL